MKNIHKLAEEIFQAPSEVELINRWMQQEGRKEPQNIKDVVELAEYAISPPNGYFLLIEEMEFKMPNILKITIPSSYTVSEWEYDLKNAVAYKAVKYWAQKFKLKIKIDVFKSHIKNY